MSEKRKISIRKVLQALVTCIVIAGCITAVLSATKQQRQRKVKGISVHIENDKYGFVDEDELKRILMNEKGFLLGKTNMAELNVKHMEDEAEANPWIKNAQVYVDNDKELHVYVKQGEPKLRIFEKGGRSYYLDKYGDELPLSKRYVHYAPVVTNVPELKGDSASVQIKNEIIKLVNYIEKDTFWRAQVSQVVVAEKGGFELIPVLGRHKVVFGSTDRMEEKFQQLFVFYTNVLNKIGWDKYDVLDVSYKGQLVASPSIPINVPEDMAKKRIHYVTSARNDSIPAPVVSSAVEDTMNKGRNATQSSPNIERVDKLPTIVTKEEKEPRVERVQTKPREQEKKKENKPEVKPKEETKENKTPKYIYGG